MALPEMMNQMSAGMWLRVKNKFGDEAHTQRIVQTVDAFLASHPSYYKARQGACELWKKIGHPVELCELFKAVSLDVQGFPGSWGPGILGS